MRLGRSAETKLAESQNTEFVVEEEHRVFGYEN